MSVTLSLSPQPKEYDSELICFYYDNHRTPSLVIRPMKVEVVFHKPRIFILRSVSLSPSLLLRLSTFHLSLLCCVIGGRKRANLVFAMGNFFPSGDGH